MERRWQPIIPHLQEFRRQLAGHLPELRIVPANDRSWSDDEFQTQRMTGILSQYGVYLIFAPDESLEYVGLAMYSFDKRVWSHDEHINRQWTDVIAFSHQFFFLAPALEFWLICRLHPPRNKSYRGYTCPDIGPTK